MSSYIRALERERRQGEEAIRSYAGWVSRVPWCFYGHFTTLDTLEGSPKYTAYWQDKVSPEVKIPDDLVLQYWKRIVRRVSQDLYGRRYRENGLGLSWVMGIEENWRERHKHIHIVVYGEGLWRYHRNCIRALWEKAGLRTGLSRLERYNWDKFSKRGLFYLAKHQIKQGKIRDFITKRHQYYFLTGKAHWWKDNVLGFRRFLNYIHPGVGQVPAGQYDMLSGFLCFGDCRDLHKVFPGATNSVGSDLATLSSNDPKGADLEIPFGDQKSRT